MQGAAVPVAQWRWSPSAPSSVTQDPVVCDVARIPPPACMQGAPFAPMNGANRGFGPRAPWVRNAAMRSPTDSAGHAPVRARRFRAWAYHVRIRSPWSANPGMVSPLLIERTAEVTCSTAHSGPAVSTTKAPVGSATM